MPNFKISVSKENKSYTIMLKAQNEAEARDRVHKEWYSILGVKEISDKDFTWQTFIFEAYKNWEVKHWKIAWADIFKVYVNLVKNLEYDVFALYEEKNKDITKEEKDEIIQELKEEYELFFKTKAEDSINKIREKIKKEKWEVLNTEQFHMKKELEETNKLIGFVLIKLSDIIDWKSTIKVDDFQKEKMRNIYNSIIKLKKSTNISKLKEIWEVALQKIWKLELEAVEETKDSKSRELLSETNKLLKELWSKEKFIEKEKDFSYQFKKFVDWIKEFFKKPEKKDENTIDKESYYYIRNKRYLTKYQEKLKENTKYILSNFFKLLFDAEKRSLAFEKRIVIKRNIYSLKMKLEWKTIKYSNLFKYFGSFSYIFSSFIDFLKINLLFIIFIYFIAFFTFLNVNYNFGIFENFNYNWIYLFVFLILAYILLSLSKKIIFLIINFALFYFIIILWAINF